MNKLRPFLLAAVIVAAALLAYGLFTLPKAQSVDSKGFSAERALDDIEVISKEHHSVAHPKEREQVRNYLIERLEGLGADTVKQFQYDSLVGPENKHVVYTFDGVDVLAEFAPASAKSSSDVPSWLMFVAHYDSRYSQPMPKKDTVWSYGAADDGYGVSVILETVSELVKNRSNWNQGVKVLFTDAEEVGMLGMKAIWENNREEFDKVGLMINLEARGTWGPALLFETSPGNEKLLELYGSQARYPYTYSLTSVVYSFLPNFTDFTIVKDEIPGLNFSTIADINHYHTHLDNFENVSANSVQHYGEQILPIAEKFVTDPSYADPKALVSDEDTVNFTIPALGLINMDKGIYKTVNIILIILFLGFIALEALRGRVKVKRMFKNSAIVVFSALGVLILGELVAWICSMIAGAQFKLLGVIHGIYFDNWAMIIFTVVLVAALVAIYVSNRAKTARSVTSMRSSAVANAKTEYAISTLYGVLTLMSILSAVLLFALGENLMFIIPLFFATIALILWRITSLRLWLLLAIAGILLHALSFLFALAMALTIGAYGVIAMLALIDIMVLISLSDLYTMQIRK